MPGILVDRVVAVIAQTESGRTTRVGSGYLLDVTRVLTASHCTVDGETGRTAARLRVVRARDGAAADVTVSESAPGLDVALLVVTGEPPWGAELPGGPVAFGSLDRDHAGQVDCDAAGFPRWQADDDRGFRDVAEVHGPVRMLEGRESQRAVLRDPVLEGVAADGGPTWAGFSGAAVFHRGLLLGVVIEHHARQGGTSLQFRPVAVIAEAGDDAPRRLAVALGIDKPGTLHSVPDNRITTDAARDVVFDPAPLESELDLAHFTGRDWLITAV
jgi:hypothetical protein